jgi:hypothetical protein
LISLQKIGFVLQKMVALVNLANSDRRRLASHVISLGLFRRRMRLCEALRRVFALEKLKTFSLTG